MNIAAFLAILRTALSIPGVREIVLLALGHQFDVWISHNKKHPVTVASLHSLKNAMAALSSGTLSVAAFLNVLRAALFSAEVRVTVLAALRDGFDEWIAKTEDRPFVHSMLHWVRNAMDALLMSNNQNALPTSTK